MHYKPLTEVKTDIYVIMTTGRINVCLACLQNLELAEKVISTIWIVWMSLEEKRGTLAKILTWESVPSNKQDWEKLSDRDSLCQN